MSHSKIRISLSSSTRWMNCPGSVRLSEGMVSESSFYAAEGTVAHMLRELDRDSYPAVAKAIDALVDRDGESDEPQ